MKTSTFVGSALGVLLIFSVFSYAQALIQAQDPKPAVKHEPVLEVAGQIPEAEEVTAPAEASPTVSNEKSAASELAIPGETYSATAYSLRGRTASGLNVGRGLIAADPRILPLGTRVRVEAGAWSGEYLVADTGGAIKGRIIDIWTPSAREALQFGRRKVKLTVLSLPERRGRSYTTRPRVVKPATTGTPAATEQITKQQL
jgi:3D (Asp-Asp-Asp) domain-containing protein